MIDEYLRKEQEKVWDPNSLHNDDLQSSNDPNALKNLRQENPDSIEKKQLQEKACETIPIDSFNLS